MICPRCTIGFHAPRPAHGHDECPACGAVLESCCDGGRHGPCWADHHAPPNEPFSPSGPGDPDRKEIFLP